MDNIRSHHAKLSGTRKRGIIKSGLYGMMAGIIFSLAFISVVALIAYRNPDPSRMVVPFSYACMIVCSLVCGFSGAKFRGENGFLSGILSGTMFSTLLFSISQVFTKDNGYSFAAVILTYLCMILVSSLGAMFAVKRKKPRRRKR